jgi:type III secretory pathway component EscS
VGCWLGSILPSCQEGYPCCVIAYTSISIIQIISAIAGLIELFPGLMVIQGGIYSFIIKIQQMRIVFVILAKWHSASFRPIGSQ